MAKERGMALAETAATGVLWGTSFPIIAYGISVGIDPKVFAFLRFAIAAPMMVLLARLLARPLLYDLRSKSVWILGLLNAIGFLCQFLGQAYTEASVAALLVNISVLIAAIGGAALLGERFTKVKVAGTLLAIVGIFLLATKGDISLLSRSQLTGELLYLISATSWGAYIIYNKLKTDETKWDPFGVSATIILLTAIFVSPVMLTVGLKQVILSGTAWSVIMYTAFFNTTLPFILYQRGLRFLSATASSILLVLEIVTAVTISVLYLGELLNLSSVIGTISILTSVILVSGVEVTRKSLSVGPNSGPARNRRSTSWS